MSLDAKGPVLVTGGTGSFGSTMVRRLLATDIDEVRILSRDEAKQDDMRRELADDRVRFYVGDVRDSAERRGRRARGAPRLPRRGAQAGALLRVLPACRRCGPTSTAATTSSGRPSAPACESVVCLSTDKAVYPINAMGMSKALMEKIAQAFARNQPRRRARPSSVTRYGNVMYSRGSVIPLFVEQLRAGRAADGHRPDDDPVPDVARGVGRPRRVRLHARAAGRPVRPQGTGLHRRGPRAGGRRPASASTSPRSRSSAPGTARSSTRRC